MLKVLEKLYRLLWSNTTGEPYTYIMRRHPWYFIVPALGLATLTIWVRGRYRLPGLAFGVGAFLGVVLGHLWW